jgi:hypothetical protein
LETQRNQEKEKRKFTELSADSTQIEWFWYVKGFEETKKRKV